MKPPYPKRLIEVDLPIRKISAHARREKSIRHGHISSLHIWWARRPLAACRAVLMASLLPDPGDENCPENFRRAAAALMRDLRDLRGGAPRNWNNPVELRSALLEFVAALADPESCQDRQLLDTARALVEYAHEAVGGAPGTRPLVIDPFAGGGAIPLEALRIGADVFASDLNPVAVLLNRVVLEYIPRHGQRLSDEVRRWGDHVKREAARTLADFYPTDPDGSTPITYLWARTIRCEGPACGAEVPLVRSLWLAKRAERGTALRLVADRRRKAIDLEVIEGARPKDVGEGTMRKGSATCPVCEYTTPNARVRAQLAERHGGASDARLLAVVTLRRGEAGRSYRLPTKLDLRAVERAAVELAKRRTSLVNGMSPVPDEPISAERPSPNARGLSAVTRMGVRTFGDLFSSRQALALSVFVELVRKAGADLPVDLGPAVRTCLALCVDKVADLANACCRWEPVAQCPRQLFARQAVPIVWDFAEGVPIGESSGSWDVMVDRLVHLLTSSGTDWRASSPSQASATAHPLPDDSAAAMVTDPPYYDAVPYADLSDFFYVWLRRTLYDDFPDLLKDRLTPKDEEAIWNPSRVYSKTGKPKDEVFYESQMARALAEGRRVTSPWGIGVVVFAHKSTSGWEAILSALIESGWIATASWPIDTEMGSRVNAMGTASLASSVHIVCRPRENPDGSRRDEDVGSWRGVLAELPRRIHEWMPRLAAEGVVGADAIFACIGPALEVFSRYSRVEKASGAVVLLPEYLEQVWAAVAREALSMIFDGADASGLEEDARLTAMWLWTLGAGGGGSGGIDKDEADEVGDDDEDSGAKGKALAGFVLEFDAARKIAQGLGAHLDKLDHVVEVKADKARLLSVAERAKVLFGKDAAKEDAPKSRAKSKSSRKQLGLFAEIEAAEKEGLLGEGGVPSVGQSTLDRVHQAMLLFGAGRSEALKRFVVEEGVGQDARFWKLGQSLSALYPSGSDEKRWVDGVLARKKGMGFG